MERTKEEIKRQVEGLQKMKKTLPQYSFFGDDNWAGIDAQLDVIEGIREPDDFESDSDEIYSMAQQAEDWLNGSKDDLFED